MPLYRPITGGSVVDGTIAKADLDASVQASLDLADSALQAAPVTSVDGDTGAVDLSGTYGRWPVTTPANVLRTPTASSGSDTVTQASGSWGSGHRSILNQTNWHEFSFYLRAGTYTVETFVTRATSGGILTVALDGSTIGTVDTYNGSSDAIRNTVTGFVVATTGAHTLRLTSTDKNASSSGYICRVSEVLFTRTVDS